MIIHFWIILRTVPLRGGIPEMISEWPWIIKIECSRCFDSRKMPRLIKM